MHITLRKSTSGSSMVLKPAASRRSACLTKSGPSAVNFMRYFSSNFKQNGRRPCVSFALAFSLGARMGPSILIVKFQTSWAYICSAARSWLHAHVVACSFACVNGEWYTWIHLVTPHYVKSFCICGIVGFQCWCLNYIFKHVNASHAMPMQVSKCC